LVSTKNWFPAAAATTKQNKTKLGNGQTLSLRIPKKERKNELQIL